MNPAHNQFILIIRIACVMLFLGRGWQHFFWDAPFRTILWSEQLLGSLVESVTSMTWQQYATNPMTDKTISIITKFFGVFYFAMAGICFTLKSEMIKRGRLLILASLCLFVLSFVYYIAKSWRIGMLIEHASQYGLPLVFYVALFKENYLSKYMIFFKTLIAMTFIGHGLFAIGLHPVPGKFVDMIISVFGISEANAILMLKVAGTLDFLAAMSLFIPPFVFYALIFNIFWGITTAFARVVANFDFDLAGMSAHQWILEVVYRLPHGLLPLALFLSLKKIQQKEKQA